MHPVPGENRSRVTWRRLEEKVRVRLRLLLIGRGTATTKLEFTRKLLKKIWRRGWDLNPRYPLRYVRFRGGSFQPLTHLSASDKNLDIQALGPGRGFRSFA